MALRVTGKGRPAPWEQAIMGTVVKKPGDPVEVEQIVRSFDPCLVCTVHTIQVPLNVHFPGVDPLTTITRALT